MPEQGSATNQPEPERLKIDRPCYYCGSDHNHFQIMDNIEDEHLICLDCGHEYWAYGINGS